ncbi:hypothetical protein M422DRAFT_258980 [Sphaerobolus stellatus SS14]|uniref:Heme haloperoxidase family profile domain-containing protein n=1 Tax=Sphaerobolus stellatus (strain SS14) TaxID=990650 RepID=A0A0C9UU05_SPHS4|nr:hypothetical protein M422DRAFT_258980 [Sphaerobolus stellatus SS14]
MQYSGPRTSITIWHEISLTAETKDRTSTTHVITPLTSIPSSIRLLRGAELMSNPGVLDEDCIVLLEPRRLHPATYTLMKMRGFCMMQPLTPPIFGLLLRTDDLGDCYEALIPYHRRPGRDCPYERAGADGRTFRSPIAIQRRTRCVSQYFQWRLPSERPTAEFAVASLGGSIRDRQLPTKLHSRLIGRSLEDARSDKDEFIHLLTTISRLLIDNVLLKVGHNEPQPPLSMQGLGCHFNAKWLHALPATACLRRLSHYISTLDQTYVVSLADQIYPSPALVGGLSQHGTFEGDTSMTHVEAFFGDQAAFNETLFQGFVDTATKFGFNGTYDVNAAAELRNQRLQNSIRTNPQLVFTSPHILSAYSEAVFPTIFFVDGRLNNRQLTIDTARQFFDLQQMPTDFHRQPAPVNFTIVDPLVSFLFNKHPFSPGVNYGKNNFVLQPQTPAHTITRTRTVIPIPILPHHRQLLEFRHHCSHGAARYAMAKATGSKDCFCRRCK